jgi:uncharacterized membrane protein
MKNTKIEDCTVCLKKFPHKLVTPYEFVAHNVSELIEKEFENWSEGKFICFQDLKHFRSEYIKKSILQDQDEISEIEESVILSLKEHEAISENINEVFKGNTTLGDRFADKIAKFGGSWKFIIIFFSILGVWIIVNSITLIKGNFDPYPFILLNLILSCLASIQAPIIMMSQNRQATKDRLQADMDYKVNLKAELEIRHLKTKLDQLSSHQWRRLLEIQQLQTDLIQEISNK